MQSGSLIDTEFATGFLAAFTQTDVLLSSYAQEHWRPISSLGMPLGKVIGDIGFTFRKRDALSDTLLIVEREGSGPGNERNILKWFETIRKYHQIFLIKGNQQYLCQTDHIILYLAFCHSGGWSNSDFQKTVAFCDILATLVNQETQKDGVSFEVLIDHYQTKVSDWKQCGAHFAKTILQKI